MTTAVPMPSHGACGRPTRGTASNTSLPAETMGWTAGTASRRSVPAVQSNARARGGGVVRRSRPGGLLLDEIGKRDDHAVPQLTDKAHRTYPPDRGIFKRHGGLARAHQLAA